MNYIFVSPHFPSNFKYFVMAMKKEGINVLGLGSEYYDNLDQDLRNSLTEYYRVEDMEDYEQVLRACGYFTFKYGKIDYIESHNEYWLETDARLRTDFNVAGYKNKDMPNIKMKSQMKNIFERAGIPVARGEIVRNIGEARKFILEAGYPVCAKPDNGVGAANTYRLSNAEELDEFFSTKADTDYIMEEFINGQIHTFDGLVDRDGKVIFKNSFIFETGVMDTVNHGLDQFYYNQRSIPEDLMTYGLNAVREFGLKDRFFHIEFFRMEDGRLIALEINVRPPGGLSLDMFNYGSDIDIYKLYAKMVAGKEIPEIPEIKYYCGFLGVKNRSDIDLALEQIVGGYGDLIIHEGPIASIFAAALGEYFYILRSEDFDRIREASNNLISRVSSTQEE